MWFFREKISHNIKSLVLLWFNPWPSLSNQKYLKDIVAWLSHHILRYFLSKTALKKVSFFFENNLRDIWLLYLASWVTRKMCFLSSICMPCHYLSRICCCRLELRVYIVLLNDLHTILFLRISCGIQNPNYMSILHARFSSILRGF